jgi:hypothetical protein
MSVACAAVIGPCPERDGATPNKGGTRFLHARCMRNAPRTAKWGGSVVSCTAWRGSVAVLSIPAALRTRLSGRVQNVAG